MFLESFKGSRYSPAYKLLYRVREVRFFAAGGGGGVGQSILDIFCEKSRGPPTSQNGLMHDPSQIPTQKHAKTSDPPPTSSKAKNNRKCYSHNPICAQSS